uniref:Claudin n=1 Tax=Denticeps clupeoides TaxID=299321 RepID=A0AAY4DD64_9TELE
MAALALELVGVALSVLGWTLSVLCCALPMWRVTAFIGSNIVTAQITWEGLWMNCVVQSTGQMQCKIYDSMLALSSDLQAARAMTVISIILGLLGLLISIMGAQCTNCIEDEGAKAKTMIVSGVMLVLSGVLQLVPASWSANRVIRDFYSALTPEPMRRELGASIYLGWAAAAVLVLGGAMLCCTCPPRERKYKAPKAALSGPRSAGAGYDRKDYATPVPFLLSLCRTSFWCFGFR